MNDASQLRGVMQALVVCAQNNREDYPFPGNMDIDNTTITEVGTAKNHSANVWSILIYNGFLPVDLMVSPAEANERISPFTNSQFSNPPKAVDPVKALWDPAFSVDFTKGQGGTSYAHTMPTANRLPR